MATSSEGVGGLGAAAEGRAAPRPRRSESEGGLGLPLFLLACLLLTPVLTSTDLWRRAGDAFGRGGEGSDAEGVVGEGKGVVTRWLTPHNPLPTAMSAHQVTIQLCVS